MAKIFGTSSEDEGNSRNSKPPTPNTSGGKTSTVKSTSKSSSKTHLTRMEVVNFSDNSDAEKRLDSPALMSDSDDDVPSRPPTPTFPAAKTGAKPQEQSKVKEQAEAKEVVQNEEVQINKNEVKPMLTNESSEDELLPKDAKYETKKELERSRRLSAHERQKQSENLFDSLLTVNVDLPSKSSRKSPGGGLKSPASAKSPGLSSAKSPGLASAKSPGLKSGSKPSEAQKSPGSHRSPLLSPGGKPIYLLAHTFNKSAGRDEKRPKEQETILKPKTEETLKEVVNAKDENEVKPVAEETKPLLTLDEDRDSSQDSTDIKIIEEVSNKAEDDDIIECAVLPKSSTKSDDSDKAKKPEEKTSTELKRKPSTDKKAPSSK